MSQIIKPVMLDETGQVTNQKLTDLGTKIDQHKSETAGQIGAIATKIDQHKTETSSQISGIGTKLTNVATNLNAIAEGIASVHSVNGQTGDVVIDSTNIPVSQSNSKTIAQVLSEEQTTVNSAVSSMQSAIARTPVSFSASAIEDDDFLLTVALSTP